ncbi:hypothetical protein CAEBREN_04614 [Caenorhabditis brenneri]|uniref:Uncharacterized protein n=1 Tax=Caenorhabditis brenneri TaxID=135651 RepID=G0NB24_CAEBE|nr:hypothetical protein CAEBREN_04614 [Caenorhabditis brenneri]
MNPSPPLPPPTAFIGVPGVVDDFQMSCRFSNFGNHQPEAFDSVTCGACFYFIFMLLDHYRIRYIAEICNDQSGVLICPIEMEYSECNCQNRAHVYNLPQFALNTSKITSFSDLHLDPPLPFQFELIVKDCCSAARYCCHNHNQDDAPCPATWDGWNCFDSAQEGIVPKHCPNYIYGGTSVKMDYDRQAIKSCTKSGWDMPEGIGGIKEHTDYMGCMSKDDAEVRMWLGLVTYILSVLSLLPAIVLLSLLRPIRTQPMFILHRHLLISCFCYGLFYLLTVWFYVRDDAPLSYQVYQNDLLCRLVFSIQLRYLRMTNFSWMLAEGVYLFRLLYTAQHSEGETMKKYIICGWGAPGVMTIAYMAVRGKFDDSAMCWIENSSVPIELFIVVPSVLAISVNVVLLLLIVYVLVKKIRGDPHLEKIQYRKAVRGAFMLIPVFGVQQLLTIYRFNSPWYQNIDQALNGAQGLLVSIIVCYTNRSVLDSLSKWVKGIRETHALGVECRQRMSIQENGKLIIKTPTVAVDHVSL